MYKVLIADDEVLDLEGMRTFIPWEELGLEVVAAVNNGYEAYDVLRREQIDILVTDVHMPSMTGLELARKALDRSGGIRIVFVSGYQDFHYVKQALALKAYSYVLKPMDDDELVGALVRIREELDRERKERADMEAYRQLARLIEGDLGLPRAVPQDGLSLPQTVAEGKRAGSDGDGKAHKNSRLIREVIRYVGQNLGRNVTLKEVADRFSFSPNHLGVVFKEETGRSFSEFVIALRMEKAGELLQDPSVKIYEVAYRVGYRYMPYFSRQFKETFGMTPAEYRRR